MKLIACDYCGKVGGDVRNYSFPYERTLDPSGNGYEDITISFDACPNCYAEILYDALRDAVINGVVKRRADNKKQIEYEIGERIRRAVAKKKKVGIKNRLWDDEEYVEKLTARIIKSVAEGNVHA